MALLGLRRGAELYTPESETEGFVPGFLFAAYLLFYVTKKHCYGDGNKRLGWACMTFVLLGFGLTIQASDDEIVEFCNAVARNEVKSGAEVAIWMSARITSIV
jgi:death-on-curing family protein